MKKYKVYDLYEGKDTIGYADTMGEVKKIVRRRIDDTDGECECVYAEINPITSKYKFSECKLILV